MTEESNEQTNETRSGTRRLLMNTQTCEDYDMVPLPARQQLGDQGKLRDARSGNGVNYELGNPGQGSGQWPTEVTYHLDSTPPPAEPGDAPGTPGSGRARAVTDGSEPGTVADRFGYRQAGSYSNKTQMRTQPGRDQRIMEARGDHEEEVIDVADGGTAGHLKMPEGVSHSAQEQQGVFQGRKSEEAASGSSSTESANSTRGSAGAGSADRASSTSAEHESDRLGGGSNKTPAQSDVPDGNVNEILEWVGDDKLRARRALESENKKENPRKSLVSSLNEKL